jgi:2-methylisocitrate lyase-like PEP mutase family enzyme
MLFVEAPRQRDELGRIGMKFGKSVPLMANMVEGGKTPILPASELEALGFALVIFPGRHRARARQDGRGILRFAQGAWQHRAVSRAHVRLRRRSTASSARRRCWSAAPATPMGNRIPETMKSEKPQ